MNELALAVRCLVALVFLTAAVGKVRHRLAFEGVVANYRLVPEFAVPAFALLLPPVETAIAAALLFAPSFWPEVCAALLLMVFAAAMAINIVRGRRHIDCGCFHSALKQALNWTLVGRNVGLALLLAVPAAVPEETLGESAVIESLLIGVILFVLLQSMNILWSVVPAWRARAVITGAKK